MQDQQHYQTIIEQVYAFIVKVVPIPALIAILIKVSIQLRRKKTTILGAIISLFVGVGVAFILKGLVKEYVHSEGWQAACYAFVGIMGENIAKYFIDKADIDKAFDAIGNGVVAKIKKIFKND